MGAKRLVGLFVSLGLVIGAMVYLNHRTTGGKVLHVCTWSSYMPDPVLAEFTKRTGIKVELSYISSNEELFSKLRAGATGYDIIQPSDYMVKQMAALKMLRPLDHAQLPELSNIDDFFRNQPYDPGNQYSVPFSWGTTGFAVNTDKVKVPDGDLSWQFLFHSPDPKHTSVLDDMREVFAATLMSQGQSVNAHDLPQLQAAKHAIEGLKSGILMFSSEPRPLLTSGELTIAHIYSTDALLARRENPKIRFYIPKEGAVLWMDNLAITASTDKVAEAHQFINYFLNPDVAIQVSQAASIATPNKTARERLPESLRNDPGLYPSPEVMKRLQLIQDLGDSLSVMNQMWTELKS